MTPRGIFAVGLKEDHVGVMVNVPVSMGGQAMCVTVVVPINVLILKIPKR